jgi:hypothetical protein
MIIAIAYLILFGISLLIKFLLKLDSFIYPIVFPIIVLLVLYLYNILWGGDKRIDKKFISFMIKKVGCKYVKDENDC